MFYIQPKSKWHQRIEHCTHCLDICQYIMNAGRTYTPDLPTRMMLYDPIKNDKQIFLETKPNTEQAVNFAFLSTLSLHVVTKFRPQTALHCGPTFWYPFTVFCYRVTKCLGVTKLVLTDNKMISNVQKKIVAHCIVDKGSFR